ncbi:MAG: metallophosphoesterase [Sphaerochaetaceae bacterium]|nr:metallophosphoesterase [Sphaerochaetaceae bacterium]
MTHNSFTLISDIHMGDLIECRPGDEAEHLLNIFFDLCESEVIIDLGDRVNNHDYCSDSENTRKIVSLFRKSGKKTYPVLGNHDLHNVTIKENLEILGLQSSYYSKIINGIRFIFLNTADPVRKECMGHISCQQLKWLEQELTADDLPKIICAHHPFFSQDMKGNPFFTTIAGQERIDNGEEVERILLQGKNILCYLCGHVHWFYFKKVNTIPCLAVPSFIENYPLKEQCAGRYCEFSIEDRKIEISFKTVNPSRVLGKIEYDC